MTENDKVPVKPMILIMDDTAVVLELLKRYLTAQRYEVLVAETGEQGLALLEAATPDLILLDVRMPGMGGIKTLRELRSKLKNIPIIMLSGVDDVQIAQTAFDYGATDYVTKPIDLATLKKVMATHLVFAA